MSTLTLSPAFHPVRPVRRVELRLTHRGRLVVFVASLLAAFAIGIMVSAGSVASSDSGTPVPTQVVTVGTGDTLWGIAADLAEDGEVRDMMVRIERLNALETPALAAGQRLVVPIK
ncbi:LysM peptidoglycan-binding domain-containing protein [Nocardioides sp.]|uniref:LysM peptidoglycan-binding domain-containing protein n=1 Tax=Nocardioides sp. TaxID=35761 RepID=UPI003564D0A6